MWITLIAAPPQWWWMWVGFGLFRLFDIWKPWPVSWADRRVHGGLGVMLDDVLAGIYAAIVLQVLAWVVRALA
jgi:phosphatidylglycerophosphatase A